MSRRIMEEEERNNVISIYTPSVTLNSPEEYAGRIKFLVQLLADKNCPANKADEFVKEIKNLAGYLCLIQLRRIYAEEQQKKKKQETAELKQKEANVKIKNETTGIVQKKTNKFNKYQEVEKENIRIVEKIHWLFYVSIAALYLTFVLFYYVL